MKDLIDPLTPTPSRIHIVPYFYDSPFSSPSAMPSQPRIFSPGPLSARNGYDIFLTILSRLNTPYEVKIAGDGPDRESLIRRADELNVPAEFLGYQTPEQMEQWYAWCRVVALPNDFPEPMGIQGLEAMGAAKPVVAFDTGGVREWINFGINGFCVPHGDMEMFTNRLRQLLTDESLAMEMGKAGWRMLPKKFSSRSHLDQLEKTYRELAV
jgi:glycosyltransferase involved in cell wall biosynthesis